MLYAAVQSLLLIIGALILGIFTGRWWIRRSQQLAPLHRARDAARARPKSGWERLWERFDLVDGGLHQDEATAPVISKTAPRPVPEGAPAAGAERTDPTIKGHTGIASAPEFALLLDRISDLERTVRTLPRTQHQLDLSPIRLRLASIEAQLRRERAATIESPQPTPQDSLDTPDATLMPLETGDDLTQIRGVGPALARMLADNGVYYFWQIASWSEADVAFMDQRLERFSGRIERDRWVTQAARLAERPGACRPPENPTGAAYGSEQ